MFFEAILILCFYFRVIALWIPPDCLADSSYPYINLNIFYHDNGKNVNLKNNITRRLVLRTEI
ncbi:MAG: hypothetical protein A2096_02360 [Spirochaetes bacterium GWF1_41_5]|nr:MAG: hypothetical protein A2096_02360 [Spirochaetes bacterium GWF1_41_5]HBE02748.1 hypothetical protein [Spirochaetia bacterium]